MGLKNAVIYSVLGIAIVFFALLLLMLIIRVLVKLIPATDNNNKGSAQAKAPAAPKPAITAPGSAGEIALNGVDPRTAAMCMAIVANELGKPLNELRFKSIKEYSDEV